MTPEELRRRTKRFALDVIRFNRQLPRTDEARVIGRQLLRAGTAVGANYRSVCRARSDPEFIAKLGVVIEEADETAYWLEILVEAEIVPQRTVANVLREADELTRIFVASRETVRARLRTRRRKQNGKSQVTNHK
jgi:four helix bundle protein